MSKYLDGQEQRDLIAWLAKLDERVKNLESGNRIGFTGLNVGNLDVDGNVNILNGGNLSVQSGGNTEVLEGGDFNVRGGEFFVHDKNGNLQVYFGPLFYGMQEAGVGWIFTRFNGTQIFSLEGSNPDNQFLAIRDEAGNIVFSDDAITGQGIATPYIPGQFVSLSVPTDTTALTTFSPLQMALWRKQHPRIQFWGLVNVTSTTAEVDFRINTGPDAGTIIGGPVTVNNGFWRMSFGPFSVPGAHLSEFELEVRARVASGAGLVGIRLGTALGLQSP